MDPAPSLVIAPAPGYVQEVGRLVSILAYVRATTLRAVAGLEVRQLDHRHDERSNSIGALLAHVAAVEWVYQVTTFEDRDPTDGELRRWGPALDLGERGRAGIRGHPLDHYREQLSEVRDRTLRLFREVPDGWLDEPPARSGGRAINRYWMWFHVGEDELSHRGQIRWLRSRLPA
jgi:hypothetical protein